MNTHKLLPAVAFVAFSLLAVTPIAGADPGKMLEEAARKGQVERIREALAAGAEVNRRFDIGRTALIIAAKAGRVAAVEALMDAGSDWYLLDSNGWDALAHAAVEPQVSVVRALLRRGYDPAKNEWRALKVLTEMGPAIGTTNPNANQIRQAREMIEDVRRRGPMAPSPSSASAAAATTVAPVLDDSAAPVLIDVSEKPIAAELFRASAMRALNERGWQVLTSEASEISATLSKRDREYRVRISHKPGVLIKIAFVPGYGTDSQSWLNNLRRDMEIELRVAAAR